jgi:hypothetical protein
LFAFGFSENSNGEMRRRPQFWDCRLIVYSLFVSLRAEARGRSRRAYAAINGRSSTCAASARRNSFTFSATFHEQYASSIGFVQRVRDFRSRALKGGGVLCGLRGHKWPLFHEDLNGPLFHEDLKGRVLGNEIVEERLFRAASWVQKYSPFRACCGLKPAFSRLRRLYAAMNRRSCTVNGRSSTGGRRIRIQVWPIHQPCADRIHANVVRVVRMVALVADSMVGEAFLPDQSSLRVRGLAESIRKAAFDQLHRSFD